MHFTIFKEHVINTMQLPLAQVTAGPSFSRRNECMMEIWVRWRFEGVEENSYGNAEAPERLWWSDAFSLLFLLLAYLCTELVSRTLSLKFLFNLI